MGNNEQTAIRLLKDLVSLQNGTPLERDKEEYDKLMNEIYAFLNDIADREIIESVFNSHSPTEPVSEENAHAELETVKDIEYVNGYRIDTLQEGDWFQGTEEQYRKVLTIELIPKHRFSTSMIPAVNMQLSIIESDIDLYSSILLEHGYCVFIGGSLTWDEDKCRKTQLTPEEFLRRAENTFKTR